MQHQVVSNPLTRPAGLESLRQPGGLYDQLASAIQTNLLVGQVLVVEYPDATHHLVRGEPETCNTILADRGADAFLGVDAFIDQTEATLLQGFFGYDLNGALEAAAARNGWTYVGGVSARFLNGGHGYCADAPPDYSWTTAPDSPAAGMYRLRSLQHRTVTWPSPTGIRWIRRWADSAALQGPSAAPPDSKGTFHPNEWGHLAVCEQVVSVLRERYQAPSACQATLSAPP